MPVPEQLLLPLEGAKTADLKQKKPSVGVDQGDAAIKNDASACPPAPLAQVLPPAVLRHAQANQHIRLGDASVAYLLRRARRRSIGFRVDGEGLTVRAPMACSMAAIEAALRAKADWIVRKLAEQGAYQRRLESTRIAWGDGAVLPYLGQPLTVQLQPQHRTALHATQPLATDSGAVLPLALAHNATAAQVRDTVQAWLLRRARAHFTQRLDHFAPRLDVRWTRLALSSAQSRWGSARADGSIRLNWRLMHFSPEVIDYVVAHELSHLRVMDHSPRFWRVVESVVPDWSQLRRHLREQPTPPWE